MNYTPGIVLVTETTANVYASASYRVLETIPRGSCVVFLEDVTNPAISGCRKRFKVLSSSGKVGFMYDFDLSEYKP